MVRIKSKFKRRANKGFTLIELVVVIAVIAILGGVAVAAYFGVTNSANLTADQATVKQMNDILIMEDTMSSFESPKDALKALYNNGFGINEVEPRTSETKFLYDVENNKIYHYSEKENNIIYPEDVSFNEVKDTTYAFLDDSIHCYVEGVTNYIATVSNYSLGSFDNVTDSTINIFLNDFMVSEDAEKHTNLKFSHGYYYDDSISSQIDESTMKKLKKVDGDASGLGNKVNSTLRIENAYIEINLATAPDPDGPTSGGKNTDPGESFNDLLTNLYRENKECERVEFENCVFTGTLNDDTGRCEFKELIINDCKFINSSPDNGKWTVGIGGTKLEYFEITNTEFSNVKRGINLMGSFKRGGLIENNTFNLANDEKANCVQLGNNFHNNTFGKITLNNNTVENANAYVVIHEGLSKNDNSYVTSDELRNYIVSSNTTVLDSEEFKGLVLQDPDFNSTNNLSETLVNNMKSLVETLKEIIR